ncbi:MAG: HEAT repeat domain-containing protein [Elusimicrobiota bacterium]
MKNYIIGLLTVCFFVIGNCNVFAEENQKSGKQFIIEQQKRKEEIKKNLPKLLEKLKTAKGERRWRLIYDIGVSEDKKIIEPLIKIVQDENETGDVKEAALKSLIRIKDTDMALPFIKEYVKNGKYKILAAMLLLKNGYGSKEIITLLEKYAREGHLEILYEDKIDTSVIPHRGYREYYKEFNTKQILTELLHHKDEVVCAKATYCLFELGDKEFILSRIDEMLKSENYYVKNIAKGILREIGDKKSKKRLQELEYQEMQEELKKAEETNIERKKE